MLPIWEHSRGSIRCFLKSFARRCCSLAPNGKKISAVLRPRNLLPRLPSHSATHPRISNAWKSRTSQWRAAEHNAAYFTSLCRLSQPRVKQHRSCFCSFGDEMRGSWPAAWHCVMRLSLPQRWPEHDQCDNLLTEEVFRFKMLTVDFVQLCGNEVECGGGRFFHLLHHHHHHHHDHECESVCHRASGELFHNGDWVLSDWIMSDRRGRFKHQMCNLDFPLKPVLKELYDLDQSFLLWVVGSSLGCFRFEICFSFFPSVDLQLVFKVLLRVDEKTDEPWWRNRLAEIWSVTPLINNTCGRFCYFDCLFEYFIFRFKLYNLMLALAGERNWYHVWGL